MRLMVAGLMLMQCAPALAAELPAGVREMLEAAARTGTPSQISAVTSFAKQTNPDSHAEIDSIVGEITAAREAAREARLREASFFQNWKGSGQVGGSISTGNSDARTLSVGIQLAREAVDWRHAFGATADVQYSSGVTTQELYGVHWQSDWKFSERGWLFGRVSWDRNLAAGLRSRFTEQLGAGYRLISNPRVQLDLEGGPAVTQTRFVDRYEDKIAVRGATRFTWNITPNLQFTENASVLYQSDNTALSSTTALSSRIFRKLSARLSYTYAHETDPPPDRVKTDTISRVTLVYDF